MTGFDDDLNACAALVEKGDPDRFAATMAAPVPARRVLFPIYAFNVEVARAPWVTAEPMIAEMRLQWWADALGEIASGGLVRRHEVVTPLAHVLDARGADILQAVVKARRADARREEPADWTALESYLRDTGGALLWGAARALGSQAEDRARAIGAGQGLANYLLAVPALQAAGRRPLPQAGDGLRAMVERLRPAPGGAADKPLRIAELAAWRASGILRRAVRDPERIEAGRLDESPARRRAALIWAALRA